MPILSPGQTQSSTNPRRPKDEWSPITIGVDEWRATNGPNYTRMMGWRQEKIRQVLSDPTLLHVTLKFYEDHPVSFINHWCDTYDPRNAMRELPTRLAFVMFTRQAQLIKFLTACLEDKENGLIDKSRDMGVTWACCAYSVWLWRFRPGSAVGWGSRKEQLVDKLGDPDSIFQKLRMLINGLPLFFWPRGFSPSDHMTYMKIVNPENDATITGEAGDKIGRGGRKLIYFKDESAHYEHPESIESALGDNTNVQIDISTPNGVGTVFDRKRNSGVEWEVGQPKPAKGKLRVFVMDWTHHPMKTQEWHDTREKAAADAGLLHLFRQEVDRDAAASLSGIIIKPEWVRAAVDAHIALEFDDKGRWSCGFDPYDEGGDLHAVSFRKGVVLWDVDDWGDGDTGEATRQVLTLIGNRVPITIQYDSVGIGAGVKSEANRLKKEGKLPRHVTFSAWDAGQGPLYPDDHVIEGDSRSPINKDFYANMKAQAWWELARRFERVYRMRKEGIRFPVDQLISLNGKMEKLQKLMRELSQPVMVKTGDLRLQVDKKPEGAMSPNLADSVVMNYFPLRVPMHIPQGALDGTARPMR